MMKRSMQHEVIRITVYQNTCMTQKLTELRVATDNLIIIAGDYNIPLSMMGRIIRQIINKDIENLNNTQTRPRRHLSINTPPSRRIYILLKSTYNVLRDRP